jgi:flagellin
MMHGKPTSQGVNVMGLYINTNLSSLNAQRQLTSTSSSLSRSFERLSSGLRINGAKDDAAGLSITTRFTAQIRGLNQAVRNSNDGISLAQTAEGALNETTNILQRMRELSVQSANDTNNDSDRASLQAEVDQLKSELNRIAETTNFNGNKILSGDFLAQDLQVGANVGETLSVSINAAGTKDLARQVRTDQSQVGSGAITAGSISITYKDAGSATGYSSADVRASNSGDDKYSTSLKSSSAIAKAAAINSLTETTGVRAIVGDTTVSGTAMDVSAAANNGELDGSNYIELNGEKISGFSVQANDADGSLVDAINAVADETGVTAALDSNSELVLTAADGRNIEITTVGAGGSITGLNGSAATVSVTTGKLALQSDNQFDLAGNQGIVGQVPGVFGVNSDKSVDSIDIKTRKGAVMALDTIDLALEDVSASRAELGALQNRLESTISNLSTTSENLSASRSRIQDADFASETAKLSRNQIIQQAGVSILAQANQQPQVALALLG